jgi:hypothetical protein
MRSTQPKHLSAWLLAGSWLVSAVGCDAGVSDPQVAFGDSKPLGRWDTPGTSQTTFVTEGLDESETESEADEASSEPKAAAAGSPASASSPSTTSRNNTTTQPQRMTAAGRSGGTEATSGAAGAAANSGMSMAGAAAAAGAAAPSEGAAPAPSEVTGLTFSFTTEVLGGRYKPKNIGAVWVTDGSGKLVKSLEVWARIRLRYLTQYAAARSGARVDAMSTATLTNHKAHTSTWDLKDISGAAVAKGKYTLHAEVTDDHNVPTKTLSIPFDTSAGSMSMTPPNADGFLDIALKLE